MQLYYINNNNNMNINNITIIEIEPFKIWTNNHIFIIIVKMKKNPLHFLISFNMKLLQINTPPHALHDSNFKCNFMMIKYHPHGRHFNLWRREICEECEQDAL